ncbi:MAG: hypothetical protein Q8M07_09305, partial [Prosthecobacter sp.]|nr:hypothetical protein [Prosthecobacter sp.]
DISFVQSWKEEPSSYRVHSDSFTFICSLIEANRKKLTELSSKHHFEAALSLAKYSDFLRLSEFNVAALAEIARLLWERVSPSHPDWGKELEAINAKAKSSKGYRKFVEEMGLSISEWADERFEQQRRDIVDVLQRIQLVLERERRRRESMPPHVRLLAALHFRADKLLPDFMEAEGVATNAYKKMQRLIIEKGWPKNLMRFMRLPQHMESYHKDLP